MHDSSGIARRVLKNFLSLSGATVVTKLLAFASTAYLARVLNAEGFGILGFAQAAVVYFQLILNQGLDTYGTREIARSGKDIPRYVNNIVTIRILLSLAAYAMLAAFALLIPKPFIVKGVILILGLKLFEVAFNLKWVFQGTEKMEWLAVSRIVQQAIFVAGVFVLIKRPSQVVGVPILQVAAGAVGIVLLLSVYSRMTGKIRFNIDTAFWKEAFTQSLPMAASYFLIQIYINFDMIFLGFIRDEKTVGLYSAAYKLITMINLFGVYYFVTLFPNISRMYYSSTEKMERLLSKSLEKTMLVSIPLCVGGTIVAAPLMRMIFGADFAASALPFKILVWNVAVTWTNLHYGNTLVACNRQKEYMLGVSFGAVTNIVLNIIFIPRYGMTAAAFTTVFSELVVLSFMYRRLNTIVHLDFLRFIPKPAAASAAMGVSIFFLRDMQVVPLIGIGAAIYFLCAILLGAVKRREIVKLYREATRKRAGIQ